MSNLQGITGVKHLWTGNPLDSEATIMKWPAVPVLLLGILEEEPRYIRDVDLKVGAIMQLVTTPTLHRGYITRAVNEYLLCEIDSQEESQEVTLTFVGMHRTIEEADTWIKELKA
jgi:hypothetical protein